MRSELLLIALLAVGCTEKPAYEPKRAPPSPSSSASQLTEKLRPHTYGPQQMSRVECVKLEGVVLVGKDCPGGFAVFGPYVPIGPGNDVEFTFVLSASEDVSVTVDLAAETGKILFAAAPDQSLKKDEARRFSLRSRPQVGAKTLEARIAIASTNPVSYTISELALHVR